MPVILDSGDIDDWLNGQDLQKMVKPINLEAYPVSKEVNSVKVQEVDWFRKYLHYSKLNFLVWCLLSSAHDIE